MNKRGRIVVGNWKQYIDNPKDATLFAKTLRKRARTFAPVEAWLAPSFLHLPLVAVTLKGAAIKVGAQAVAPFDDTQGKAHTGYISPKMIKNSGASFTIVGHSERRPSTSSGQVGEDNSIVHQELFAALRAGLTTILCVGERERDDNGNYFNFIADQLQSALAGAESFSNKIIIAYEPVWAIGKSAADAMQPAELQETVIFIRKTLVDIVGREKALKVPILYGGSVEPTNAQQLIVGGEVSGFLVGHASASVDSFIEILKACKK